MPASSSLVMSDFDVIVGGGGPAGATAAAFCAQRGLRVALFEHARFPRHKVCGDVINPNCWPVLERLGVAGKIRALPHHEIDGALFATMSTQAVTIPLRAATIAIRRSLFDAALLQHAQACGVQVFEGETVHGITADKHVVTSNGRHLAIKGIIGAEGRHSVTAQKAGLVRWRRGHNGHIAFQSHFRAPHGLDNRVQLHLFRGGYCGVVRVDTDRANLCIVTDPQGVRSGGNCEALFERTVWQNPRFRDLGISPEPLESLRSAHPLQAPMNVPARNGVFLTGDALRVMEPFTGQGIFFALRTAELASEALCSRSRPEVTYAAAVTALYRQRGRTNEWLRRVMYRERAARMLIPIVQHAPRLARWLADNVLGDERRFR
jgi:flavin-dependent dehydrogenase